MNTLTDDDALDTFRQVLARIVQRLDEERRQQNQKPPSDVRESGS